MRNYLVFGSNDDGKTLHFLGDVDASDHDAAKKAARQHDFKKYATCPSGNWSLGGINVREIVDVVPADMPQVDGQMTVEEVLEETQDKIAEAREALSTPPQPLDDMSQPEEDDSTVANRS